MVDLGYNYRVTDIQCVLGLSQLKKLPDFVSRRGAIAAQYDAALANSTAVNTLSVHEDVLHAYHLYIVKLQLEQLRVSRLEVFEALRAENIGVNVHYMPLYMHPYHKQFVDDDASEICPVAEEAYECILSLPIFPSMTDEDVAHVIEALNKVVNWFAA
jgi:perosamine synthetase